jgi:hypothetical protein
MTDRKHHDSVALVDGHGRAWTVTVLDAEDDDDIRRRAVDLPAPRERCRHEVEAASIVAASRRRMDASGNTAASFVARPVVVWN